MGANVRRGLLRLMALWLGVCGLLAGWPAAAQTPDQTLFGPKQYVRTTGAPNQYSDTFTLPASVGAPFQVHIVNGDASGGQRISSAWVTLNGVQIAGPADFGQNVAVLDRTVNLAPNNTLQVRVASTPGAYLTITVRGTRILPVPTSLAPNPLTISAGASGTLTATLSPAPASGGTLAVSSANSAGASVPTSVSFASGQTQVVIPVHGVSAGNTTVTASLNGGSASATVNVTPAPPTLTSLTPGTLSVTQGASGTLTVTISSSQTATTTVSVASSNSGVASVPSSVTVAAGQVSASISVGALSAGNSDITASLNGTSAVSHVTVTAAPPSVVSLVPAVATVTLGASTTLTLTISSAQSSNTTVALAVSPPGIITALAQVIVPAGQTSVGVPVGTLAFGQAGVTASLNGSTASAAVNVVPQPVAVVAIVPATLTMNVGATSPFTVSINATQPSNTEIALSVDEPSFVQVPPTVTVAQGQTSATFTATGLAVGNAVITAAANGTSKTAAVHVSPQSAAIVSLLPSPLPLQQGASGNLTLTINVAQEADTAISLTDTDPAIANVPASVTIPAGAVSVEVPVTALTPGSTDVTASINGTSATSTVSVTLPPPTVTSLTPAALSLPKGTPGVLRVAVSRAPNAATAVALSSTNPSIASVPPEVNIPAGALFADFPVVANFEGQVTITATLNGGSAAASVTIAPAELVTLTLSPQGPTNYVGETVPFTATGTMTDGTTQDFTTRVTWTSSDPTTATIASTGVATPRAAGQTTIKASFTFNAVQTSQPVTVTQETVLTVKLPVALVLTAPSATPIEGQDTTVTVSTIDPAPFGGLLVALSGGGSGAGTFPPALTIPENGTTATFIFTAVSTGPYTVTASAQNRLPGTINFAIQPLLRISAVTPSSADVGATVTLVGGGFDPIAANNQIAFRGINGTTVPSAALTASATQITIRVPPLADSGPITLTNGRGTTQSPAFTVNREQNFQLVVSPAVLTVYQGASGIAQAQLASTGSKAFTGLVTLSVIGLPNGVTAKFTPAATLSAFQTGAITVAATGAAVPGSYSATVQAAFTESGVPFVRSSPVAVNVAAAANVTGVKGRFITQDGAGVSGIIVRADIAANPQPQVTSDAAGNFQLTGLPAGEVTLRMDASPVNPTYPIWPATVTLVASQIVTLSDWHMIPPPSDDKFTPIANATQTQIITDARYPGLAVTLPAGVTITGWDGVVKTRIAVERFDPDQLGIPPPPIPTKSVYQLFFGTSMGGLPSAPIPITHPNDLNLDPGAKSDLYYYDGSPMGSGTGVWRKAGTGTVSADGKTISSDPGAGIPRFCGRCGPSCFAGNQNTAPNPPPPSCGPGGCPPAAGQSVTLATGQELVTEVDSSIAGIVPLSVSRTFNPRDAFDNITGLTGSIGLGWALSYDVALIPLGNLVRIVMPGNSRADFTSNGAGAFEVANDARFYGAILTQVNSGLWELTYKDGRLWRFTPNGILFFLSEQRDTNRNSLLIARNANGHVQSVQGGQRSLTFAYGTNGFLSTVTDAIGRTYSYGYNPQNRISSVTAPDGGQTSYTYVDDTEFAGTACAAVPGGQRLKTIQRPGQTMIQTLFYGPGRRVLREILEDGSENKFDYKLTGACVSHVSNPGVACTANCPDTDSWENFQTGWRISGGTIVQTSFTDANGKSTTQRFNGSGLGTKITDAQGQGAKYVRDAKNRVTAMTDTLGRTWRYTYDINGNKTREIDPLNRVTDIVYDATWNTPTSITRYLPDGTAVVHGFQFDAANGNLLHRTDPLGKEVTFTYTPRGQLATITNVALGEITRFEYTTAGDLTKIVDSLNNERNITLDPVGRAINYIDPLGFTTAVQYSPLDQVTEVVDANQGHTSYRYDLKRTLRSVSSPLSSDLESYVYDVSGRITSQTDKAGKSSAYEFDAGGSLKRIVDRKGQTTTTTLDAVRKIATLEFSGGVVQTRTYDVAGRLTEIREPDHSLRYAYDDADRVVRVVTEASGIQSDMRYEYDTLDRRTKRALMINGVVADETIYEYDKASRILSIRYTSPALATGPQVATYEWDNGDRLASKTLPNGVRQEYLYDGASRIVSIVNKKSDGSIIDSIDYSYDAAGNRLSVSRLVDSSRETPFSAAYDQSNRLTSLTLTGTGQVFILSYDDNGNLVSKTEQANPANQTTYAWDTRNRLVRIDSPGTMVTFAYDLLGRRIGKTINGQSVSYVYDGVQAVGEIVNGSVATSMFTGLNPDEVIAKFSNEGGAISLLTDSIGNVTAQLKADQSAQNYYAYSPYGETVTLGPDLGNSLQYTGRENDGTGLYFYRARFYDPLLKRFISEDPLGLQVGLNAYAYAAGNPIIYVDPTGLYCIFSDGKIIRASPTNTINEVVTKQWTTLAMVPVPSSDVPAPTFGFPWPSFEYMWQTTIHQSGVVQRLYKTTLGGIWRCYDDCGRLTFQGWGTKDGPDEWQDEGKFDRHYPGKIHHGPAQPAPDDLPPIRRPGRR